MHLIGGPSERSSSHYCPCQHIWVSLWLLCLLDHSWVGDAGVMCFSGEGVSVRLHRGPATHSAAFWQTPKTQLVTDSFCQKESNSLPRWQVRRVRRQDVHPLQSWATHTWAAAKWNKSIHQTEAGGTACSLPRSSTDYYAADVRRETHFFKAVERNSTAAAWRLTVKYYQRPDWRDESLRQTNTYARQNSERHPVFCCNSSTGVKNGHFLVLMWHAPKLSSDFFQWCIYNSGSWRNVIEFFTMPDCSKQPWYAW